VVRAQAEATAQVIRAEAEAAALRLVKAALAGDGQLLTYRYIEKLSPGVRVMLLPSDNPFILPLPDLAAENGTIEQTPTPAPTSTQVISGTVVLASPEPVLTPTP
jgi:hypothetical protein